MTATAEFPARAAAFGGRWGVAYVWLYILPFPLDRLPVVDGRVAELAAPWHALVAAVGALLGVEAAPRHSGSGDTTYHYVSALCLALLAAPIAAAWSLRARERGVSGRLLDRTRAWASLYLGATMLLYGWAKLIPSQFPAPGPDRLIVPYGDSSPMGLLWTMMGASAGYEVFTGAIEVAAGILLFFRRTALTGALLAAAALANIVALNFCFDVPVKLYSSHLLALALFVLAPDLPRVVGVLRNRPTAPRELDPYPLAGARRRVAAAGKLGLLALACVRPAVLGLEHATSVGRLAPPGPLHGVYRVEKFSRGDGSGEIEGPERWLRVGINQVGVGAIQTADGTGRRYRLTIDAARSKLTWKQGAAGESYDLLYRTADDGALVLSGEFAGELIDVTLRRQPDEFPLTSRPFRWVQEAPLNR